MARRIVFWLGVLLLVLAFVFLAIDLWGGWRTGDWRLSAGGEFWYETSPGTLNAFQAGVQRNVAPWLWDPVLQTLLLWPAVLVVGLPALLLVLLFWPRRRG